MDLTVILGPPGSGKARHAIDALLAAARDRDGFLLVPGAVDRARFLREIAGRDQSAYIGVEVGTFEQLIARVAGSPPVRRTDRAMERIVVRDALADIPEFARAAAWTGFVDTARRHIDALRRARAWGGDEVARLEAQLPGESVAHWRRLEQRVGELLDERRLRDDAWFERRAARRLRQSQPGIGAVVCYGFDAFAPGRQALLERLAQHVPVTVTLAWRPGRRVHERAAELRDRWRSIGAFVRELESEPVAHPVLDWLGSELFEDTNASPPTVADPPEVAAPVSFVECCGPTQEAEEVVREVALLHARGAHWDDIVVASANASTSGELLHASFERAGIPVRLQARRTAIDVPVGRAVHALLDAIVQRDRVALAAAMRAPVFGVARDTIDDVELHVRARRHASMHWIDDRRFANTLPKAVRALASIDARDRDAKVVDAVRAVLASLRPADLGELDLLRGVASLLEGLVVAAGGESGVRLVDIRDAVAALTLATPDRSDSGAVVIASIDDLRSIAWDCVVLHGMHQAAFRAAVEDELDAPAAGRDLLHLAVTRARRTLRVIRQSAGSGGAPLAPSPGWQELRRLLPNAPLRSRRLAQVAPEPSDVRLPSERAVAVALAMGRGHDVDGVDDSVARRIETNRRGHRSSHVDGALAEELAARTRIAVTELEAYATCSAKWFIERRLRDIDPDEDRSRILDGLVAHALLQRIVPIARVEAWDAVRIREFAASIAGEIASELDPGRALHPSRVDRIVEHVVDVIDSERDWPVPDRVETEVGIGREMPDSIGPGLFVDDVELVGRIDRIDHHGSHVVLHDYKYGASDRAAARLIEERNLQLLVYWLALRQPGSPHEPIGALYRAVTSGGKPSGAITHELRDRGYVSSRSRTLDEDAREQLLDDVATLVADSVHDLRAGVVRPLDDPSDCPSHCTLQAICRVGEVSTR